MIRLSIVMPTNRDNLTAISRIAQACSWAGPQIEVIIRDNSGSESKRRLVKEFERDNCRIIAAEPCGVHENWLGGFDQAKGDFVLFVCDDDSCLDRSIAALPEKIEEVLGDSTVAGITGVTVVDNVRGTSLAGYEKIDADDGMTRLMGYLGSNHPPVLLYSAVRRDVMQWGMDIVRSKPFKLSFDDQIGALLYLLRGKFVPLKRILYCYNQANWEVIENAQREDLKYLIGASLDPALNKLHWLLCAFEGAALIRNVVPDADHPLPARQKMADLWFATMFQRFRAHPRDDLGSALAPAAEKLCVKWKGAAGQLSFENILADICQFVALFSPEEAMKYFAFWSGVLGVRQAPAA